LTLTLIDDSEDDAGTNTA